MALAKTPEPPYYAAIFTSLRTDGENGYGETARRMMEMAAQQPGFLGADSVRGADGIGITVSYWRDVASIAAWKQNDEHLDAQRGGREKWYREFSVRIARVEREYGM